MDVFQRWGAKSTFHIWFLGPSCPLLIVTSETLCGLRRAAAEGSAGLCARVTEADTMRSMVVQGVKRVVGRLLEPLGLADHARGLYRVLTQPIRTRALEVCGIAGHFWVPSARDEESVEYFTEKDQLEAFTHLLAPGDSVWDVGAGMGVYTIVSALRVGPTGAVVAFEPARRARQLLWINRFLNGCKTVRLEGVALGMTQADAVLTGSKGAAARCVARASVEADEAHSSVRLVRADTLLDEGTVRRPDCLKIDVEGAELQVLKGLGRYLHEGGPRLILCEIHPTLIGGFGSTVEDVRLFLQQHRYVITQTWLRGTEEHWLIARAALD